MNINNNDLEPISIAYDKLGKIKGLPVWKDVLINKIRSKKALKNLLESFEEDRKQVLEDLADKDENGKAIIAENKYVFSEDNEAKATAAVGELVASISKKDTDVDLITIKAELFEKISKDAELADLLEPLVLAGLVTINED